MRELAGRQQREQQDMAARQQHAAAGCPPDQGPRVLAEQTRDQQSLQHQEPLNSHEQQTCSPADSAALRYGSNLPKRPVMDNWQLQ
ncbi:hypothetical protein DIPPA_06183 [Diplonema papillatum]|nr:hypothetical protein DIPPA_34105 [Diplonema papillatum]KAJ9466979.1 hypothetical protein DIPPA_06183 [Diplonema papillatum]|eukprot:gene836-1290_t